MGVGATQVRTGPMGMHGSVAHVGGPSHHHHNRGPVVVIAPRPGPVYYRPPRHHHHGAGVALGVAAGVAVGVGVGVAMSKSAKVMASTPAAKGQTTVIVVVPTKPLNDLPFNGGNIQIALEGNAPGMLTGQKLRGHIHVNQWEIFQAYDLTLTLEGHEHVNFTEKNKKYEQRHLIINNTYPIVVFPEYQSRVGHYTFPFELEVPNWLPVSAKLREHHEDAQVSARYSLIAQLTPVFNKDYVGNPINRVSTFRVKREVMAFHQTIPIAPRNDLVFKQQAEVKSGLLGKKKSYSVLDVIFNKNTYYLNEIINFKLISNNEDSKKDVSKIVVSLMRTWNIKAQNESTSHKRYIRELSLAGVPKGKKAERDVQFQLPVDEAYPPALQNGHGPPADAALYKAFTPTLAGALFKVQYVLNVFQYIEKQDDPIVIAFPITILLPALQFGVMPLNLPPNWAPIVQDQIVLKEPIDYAELEKEAQAQADAEAQAAQEAQAATAVTQLAAPAQPETQIAQPQAYPDPNAQQQPPQQQYQQPPPQGAPGQPPQQYPPQQQY